MTYTLRALTLDEIAMLDTVPPLTGAPLSFPNPTQMAPLGQWLDALYRRVIGSTPGSGSFTTLTINSIAGDLTDTPLVLTSDNAADGVATNPAFAFVAEANYSSSQPLALFQNDGGAVTAFSIYPSGTVEVAGDIIFSQDSNHYIKIDSPTSTAGGTNGNLILEAGGGGAGNVSVDGGAGGVLNLTGGFGGAGSATHAAGAGGNVNINSGAAGANGGGGGANSGFVNIDAGIATGSGTAGRVTLGALYAAGVDVGRSGGKVGFYGNTAVIQPATTGQTAGFTAGAGTTAKDDSTYTGGNGTKAYTVGDIVKALKALGLLAAS